MKKNIFTRIAIVACGMLALAACNKDDPNYSNNGTPGKGAMTVKMQDNAANYASLDIVITGVEISRGGSDSDWVVLSSATQSIDVLSLKNGVTMDLATANNMDAGIY